jgi:hypothetical protein
MAGDAAGAQQALIELDSERHPGFPFLDPEIKLARAWVAAAEGAVSEAITLSHDAAAIAAAAISAPMRCWHCTPRCDWAMARSPAGSLSWLPGWTVPARPPPH